MAPKGKRGRGRGHPSRPHQNEKQNTRSSSDSGDSDERAALEDYLENLRQDNSDAEVEETLGLRSASTECSCCLIVPVGTQVTLGLAPFHVGACSLEMRVRMSSSISRSMNTMVHS
jgi:hypothetical protein